MATDGPTTLDTPVTAAAAVHVFAVRLWKEELASGSEYRGSVRDVVGNSFRAFRDWSDLVAFMVARLEQGQGAPSPAASKEER